MESMGEYSSTEELMKALLTNLQALNSSSPKAFAEITNGISLDELFTSSSFTSNEVTITPLEKKLTQLHKAIKDHMYTGNLVDKYMTEYYESGANLCESALAKVRTNPSYKLDRETAKALSEVAEEIGFTYQP